jgi:hypothetical protein
MFTIYIYIYITYIILPPDWKLECCLVFQNMFLLSKNGPRFNFNVWIIVKNETLEQNLWGGFLAGPDLSKDRMFVPCATMLFEPRIKRKPGRILSSKISPKLEWGRFAVLFSQNWPLSCFPKPHSNFQSGGIYIYIPFWLVFPPYVFLFGRVGPHFLVGSPFILMAHLMAQSGVTHLMTSSRDKDGAVRKQETPAEDSNPRDFLHPQWCLMLYKPIEYRYIHCTIHHSNIDNLVINQLSYVFQEFSRWL